VSLEIKSLSFSYPGSQRKVLDNVNFKAKNGDLIALLGPNGVGKSTLFRCILGFLKPDSGKILLDGQDISTLSRAQFAGKVAYIPQTVSPAFNYTILDLVLMGVTSQLSYFQSPGKEHIEKAEAILESLGISHLANRGCGQVSGGERQLALLGRALLQNANFLIMDEPTAALDYGNQYRVMQRVSDLASQGYTILMSTHDPNQAFRHCSNVIAMRDGHIIAEGAPCAALTEDVLSRLYGINVGLAQIPTAVGSITVSVPGK